MSSTGGEPRGGSFVRSSPERTSRGRGSNPPDKMSVEVVRQRALQAAEYYHSSVRTPGDQPGSGSARERGSTASRGSSNSSKGGGGGHQSDTPSSRHAGGSGNSAQPQSSAGQDAYYKHKLRTGFIDLRNSYNEKIKPRNVTYTRSLGAPAPPARNFGKVPEGGDRGGDRGREGYSPQHAAVHRTTLAERRGLYRSNSSLELDHIDYQSDHHHAPLPGALHRDYGSASSLDIMSSTAAVHGVHAGLGTGGGDSFFAMLQDYRHDNLDQRAQAPPQMQEVLRGRADVEGGARSFKQSQQQPAGLPAPASAPNLTDTRSYNLETANKVVNGSVPAEDESPSGEGSQSPKLKSKSQKHKNKQRTKSVSGEGGSSSSGGGGLLRKLRGKTDSSESSSKSLDATPSGEADPNRLDDRYRRKAFVHFDCQSIGVSLSEIAKRRANSQGQTSAVLKLKNMTTGASAASGARSGGSDQDEAGAEEADAGDGKTNDLIQSCPFFRNELGGEEERTISLNRATAQKRVQQLLGNTQAGVLGNQSSICSPLCNGVAVMDPAQSPHGVTCPALVSHKGLVLEHIDQGAQYYRNFFHGFDHQNYLGVDENLGPVAISFKREKLDEKERETSTGKAEGGGFCYQYRIIVRTSELETLRGSVLEEAIPSSSRLSNTRGLPPKDVLDFILPGELNLSSLKLATPGPRIGEELLKLDEQRLTKTYKIGVMYCRAGQQSEEEMYNNEHAGPAFEEFLECIGEKVKLQGFDKYRGGLDCKTDSTGTHSLYSCVDNHEIMFHVSTMLPFTPNNRQQLLRKRHIGNDIVTIVFQEPGALPFTPKSVRSHFQHVFIVVRAHHPNTDHVKYSLSVTRSKDVPPFGPPFADGALFSKSPEFAHFLLVKAINGENAVHCSQKFLAMASRTRQEYMKELANSSASTTSLDSASKLSKFSLGSGRRKERPKIRSVPDMFASGALIWNVKTEDFSSSSQLDCHLAIASNMLVLVDTDSKDVLATIPCKAIIGWTANGNSLRIYYNHGECIVIRTYPSEVDEITEITVRLSNVTHGCPTEEHTLRRNSLGQLGFHVHYEGIISEIEQHGFAWNVGLRDGARLVEICKVATCTLTHDQMIDLLRTSVTVRVVVIPPHEDGKPRRGIEDLRLTSSAALLAQMTFSSSNHDLGSYQDSSLPRSQASHQSNPAHQSQQPPLPPPPPHRADTKNYSPRNHNSTNYADPFAYDNSNLDNNHHHHHHDNHQHNPPSVGQQQPAPLPQVSPQTQSQVHSKQHSYDSLGSRSSGRTSEGHSSGHGSRTDVRGPADTMVSSSERLHAGGNHPMDSEGQGWSGKVTIYPAYSKDQIKGSQPNVSPREENNGQWMNQGIPSNQAGYDHYGDSSGYHSSSSSHRGTKPSPSSSVQQQVTSSASHTPYSQYSRDGESSLERSWPGARGHREESSSSHRYPSSMTNLSQMSDPGSTHSSGGASFTTRPTRGDERELRAPRDTSSNISPVGRHRQEAFVSATQRARGLMEDEASPHGSAHSSPRSSRRNLAGVASDDNLSGSTHLRTQPPGGSSTQPRQGPAPSKVSPSGGSASSTFQEDLMRLIDPDVSFSLGDDDTEERQIHSGARRKLDRGPRQMQRTQSDESICGAASARGQRSATLESRGSSDAIFSSSSHPQGAAAPPTPPPRDHSSKEHKLSPRVTKDLPGTLIRVRTTQPHAGSNPALPLPDAAAGIEWNTLVETATKAFQAGDSEHGNKSSSLGMIGDKSQPDGGATLTQAASNQGAHPSLKASKSSDLHSTASAPGNLVGKTPREGQAASSRSLPRDSLRRGPEARGPDVPRVEELEARVEELESQLHQERQERAALEAEVQRLRQDNVHLQEESQTAAAQLRKFTEWFFNTIDRQ